jgi:hypothetical protein
VLANKLANHTTCYCNIRSVKILLLIFEHDRRNWESPELTLKPLEAMAAKPKPKASNPTDLPHLDKMFDCIIRIQVCVNNSIILMGSHAVYHLLGNSKISSFWAIYQYWHCGHKANNIPPMKYLPNWMWLFGQRYQNSFVWVKEVDEHRGQSSS